VGSETRCRAEKSSYPGQIRKSLTARTWSAAPPEADNRFNSTMVSFGPNSGHAIPTRSANRRRQFGAGGTDETATAWHRAHALYSLITGASRCERGAAPDSANRITPFACCHGVLDGFGLRSNLRRRNSPGTWRGSHGGPASARAHRLQVSFRFQQGLLCCYRGCPRIVEPANLRHHLKIDVRLPLDVVPLEEPEVLHRDADRGGLVPEADLLRVADQPTALPMALKLLADLDTCDRALGLPRGTSGGPRPRVRRAVLGRGTRRARSPPQARVDPCA
jgi:hypothetical protein